MAGRRRYDANLNAGTVHYLFGNLFCDREFTFGRKIIFSAGHFHKSENTIGRDLILWHETRRDGFCHSDLVTRGYECL
jgi:hypothetical protein